MGDVLEVAVAGAPDLRTRAAVNTDGEIAFPLIGSIKVKGRSISDVRTELERTIPTKILRLRTQEGRENAFAISPEEISVNIVEYRPIYLDGDISKPGEQPYRPNMTVRQAISVAGGYDIGRFRMSNPILEMADLQTQHQVLMSEVLSKHIRISRLQAELAGKNVFDANVVPGNAELKGVLSQITSLEADFLKTREVETAREKAYLRNAIKQAEHRLSTLNTQYKQEVEGVRLDTEEVERVIAMLARGQGTVMRVNDARRALLMSSTRQLQTSAQAAQVEVQRDEYIRKLQQLDDSRRLGIIQELQSTTSELEAARARLNAVQEKSLYIGAVRSELVQGTGGKPEVLVFRASDDGEEQIVASQDMALLPGDVVQITLKSSPAGLAAR